MVAALNILLTFHLSVNPGLQAFQVHAGSEEEAAGLARERKHPGNVGPVPSTGGQWHDWVGHNTNTHTHQAARDSSEEGQYLESNDLMRNNKV